MRLIVVLATMLALTACTVERTYITADKDIEVVRLKPNPPAQVYEALDKLGLNEYQHRTVLSQYMNGFDPQKQEWCAAFVNAVLHESGMPHNYEHQNPWAARSFLDWGIPVEEPRQGDLVIFPRGDNDWQGHVGFYLSSVVMNDVVYYRILGGNQNNKVSIDLYPESKALGIRRAASI